MSFLVEERDLDFSRFRCCGDEDLYPFGCPNCKTPMVFCYECDTLYGELSNLGNTAFPVNYSEPSDPIFHCPTCQHPFPYSFMKDGMHKVTHQEWCAAGFSSLLHAGRDV